MPGKLIAEALEAWREGGRLLDDLSTFTPEHETVRLAVVRLRASTPI